MAETGPSKGDEGQKSKLINVRILNGCEQIALSIFQRREHHPPTNIPEKRASKALKIRIVYYQLIAW